MSNTTAFVTAQHALLICEGVRVHVEQDRQDAFTVSAIAAASDLRNGATLAELATANKQNAEIAKAMGLGKPSTLYTSPASVTYHAITGTVLSLPSEGDVIVPTSVQTLIVKALNSAKLSAKVVKSAIGEAKTQQGAVANLTAKIDAKVKSDAKKSASQSGSEGEGGEGEGSGSGESTDAGQTAETLLSRVVALVESGAVLSSAARAMVASLSEAPALVAVA